ncbi:MAG TPA: magnesium transporter [Flavobacteriia bacterium]|jgi:magnesium transporter|nr:magnesium transporter [Flavobacteriia bacterium]
MQFDVNSGTISQIKQLIAEKNNQKLSEMLQELHHADLAEILDAVNFEEAVYIFKLLDSETTAEILTELDDATRDKILRALSPKEIAEEIDELETDDAADIIAELPEEHREEVISHLEDVEHAKDIVDLLRYDEDTAGGIMGKEFIKVYEDWSIFKSVREMRRQAEDVDEIYTVYVVDNNEILKGILSLKKMLTTSMKSKVKDIYNSNVISVKVDQPAEEVANIMQKYDLIVLPVVDEMGRLVGRITIDDVVDIIKDEAEKDYQMQAGLSEDVEADDSIFQLVKGRLPWLVLGLIGSLAAVTIMQNFQGIMSNPHLKALFFFTPLIAAVAGNVGVQSSAIMVQGLANNIIRGSIFKRLLKEISISVINGLILSAIIITFGEIVGYPFIFTFAVSVSLISVIVIASLIGTFVPLILDKNGIDPALATGPFITTSNDIFGILIFFNVARLILGF